MQHAEKEVGDDSDDSEDTAFEDILSYNDICEYLTREISEEDGENWQFRRILGHQHTPQKYPDRMGS